MTEESKRDRVRRLVIHPLEAHGFRKPGNVKLDQHDAFLVKLADALAYMTDDQLGALRDMLRYRGEAVGGNFFERAEDWQTGSGVPRARELRALIHAALQAHHPQATLQEAGRILSQGMEIFEALMASAMTGAEAGPEKKPQAAVP